MGKAYPSTQALCGVWFHMNRVLKSVILWGLKMLIGFPLWESPRMHLFWYHLPRCNWARTGNWFLAAQGNGLFLLWAENNLFSTLSHWRCSPLLSEQEKKSRLGGPESVLRDVLRNIHSTWWLGRTFFLFFLNQVTGISFGQACWKEELGTVIKNVLSEW